IDREDGEETTDSQAAAKNQQKAAELDKQRAQAQQSAATQQVDCPDVASQLGDVPDQALAEVQNNLQQLDTQITEANNRIAATVGQGGPNFVQNAIIGPLEDKRTAVINRIQIAIGRVAQPPALNVAGLAACGLEGGTGGGNNSGGGNGGATTT